jgi:hypothetical protein
LPDWLLAIAVIAAAAVPVALAGMGMNTTAQVMSGLFSPPARLDWPAGVQEEDGVEFDVSAWSHRRLAESLATTDARQPASDGADGAPVLEELPAADIPIARVRADAPHRRPVHVG